MEKFKKFIKILWKRKFLILGLWTGGQGFVSLFNKEFNDFQLLLLTSMICFQQDDIVDLKDEINDYYDTFLDHQKFNLSFFEALLDSIKSTKNDSKEGDK